MTTRVGRTHCVDRLDEAVNDVVSVRLLWVSRGPWTPCIVPLLANWSLFLQFLQHQIDATQRNGANRLQNIQKIWFTLHRFSLTEKGLQRLLSDIAATLILWVTI